MAFEKIKKIIGEDIVETKPSNEDEYYETSKDAFKETTGGGSKMILLEPRAYSESQQIADYLKARNSVVVNLKRVTPEQAKRIVDFLYGTIYAINGSIQKLGGGIFLCTPNNVNVEGKISEEVNDSNKTTRGKKDSDDKEMDIFY